jgi:hypothetical protein
MILRWALGLTLCLIAALQARADTAAVIAVRGISVDVTAVSAEAAREKAILQGQRQGLHIALLTLASQADVDRLPALSDTQVTDLVADYEVESEQTSTVRYIGTLAFRYRLDGLTGLLQQNGISVGTGPSPPVLVLPVLTDGGKNQLWDEGNAWRNLWVTHPPSGGLVQFVLPKGDASDAAAISGDEAMAGNLVKLQALAAHYGVSDVVVAAVRHDPTTPAVAITVGRYGIAGVAAGFKDKVPGDPTDPNVGLVQAADRIADQLQQDWIAQNRVSSGVEQSLTVDASINGLADWAELNRRLASVAAVRRVDIIYLMRQRAELGLVFIGDRDQLARALQQRAMILKDAGDGHATLELAGAAQP